MNIIRHFYLIIVVILGWVLFRSDTIVQAIEYIKVMFSFTNSSNMNDIAITYIDQNKYFLIFAILLSTPIAVYINNVVTKLINKSSYKKVLSILVDFSVNSMYVLLFIINISYIVKNTYNPFIYFNF